MNINEFNWIKLAFQVSNNIIAIISIAIEILKLR